MIKFFELFLPMILLVSILAPYAHAAGGININIDVSGIIRAVNGNTTSNANAMSDTKTTLNNSITALPFDIFGLFTGAVKNSLRAFNNSLLKLTQTLLSANPDPQLMYGWWQSITIVISSFYLLIFLIIGLSFLINGHSVIKREQSKEWLKNAIIMIIGVSISFYLYKLLLELATGITKFMWMTGFENFFSANIFTGLGVLMLLSFSFTIGLALITLFLRYLILLAGVVLFPIGIFLYLTPKLQNWGKIIFNFLGVMLAIQFVDMLVLISTNQVMLQLAGNAGAGFVLPLGFLIISVVNIAMIIYAIIKSALSIANNAPIINLAVSTLTGNLLGAVGSAKATGTVS
jgi:hypothetical protein